MVKEVKKQINEVVAWLRYLRQSSRKVRLVAKSVVKLPVVDALAKLTFVNKAATRPLVKLIKSAIANAKHNFEIAEDRLFIKVFTVDQGPPIKRFRPAAFGQAHPVKKHSCHVHLVLGLLPEVVKTKETKEKDKVEKAKKKTAVAKKSAGSDHLTSK
jgi:large subunit ribosomal protein L22